MKKQFNNKEEFQSFAKEFIDFAESNKLKDKAFLVRLSGDLGAGKTTFAQAVGKYLGVSDRMQSPTFVLEKIYVTKHPVFKKLIHIDAYRIEKPEDAKILDIAQIESDREALVLIEWPEKIESLLPKHGATMNITLLSATSREMELTRYE